MVTTTIDNATIQRHITCIATSPILKPQVEDYFYQVAKFADMTLKRAFSANPLPQWPTQAMIDRQVDYAVRLGESLHIDKCYTLELVDRAGEKYFDDGVEDKMEEYTHELLMQETGSR